MNSTLNRYLEKQDIDGYYMKGDKHLLKGAKCPNDRTRIEKALEQAKRAPVPLSKVYSYINEFLELIREDNGFTNKNIKKDAIELDGVKNIIIDNGIIINNNNWIPPQWDRDRKTYIRYDRKYDDIKDKFELEYVSDLLWFKFTDSGHLAVVAKSCDINWDNNLSCGFLVNGVGERFDNSFVFVFPLTQHMIRSRTEPSNSRRKYSTSALERGVGNYLLDKGVPIIDYFSHMGYTYPC